MNLTEFVSSLAPEAFRELRQAVLAEEAKRQTGKTVEALLSSRFRGLEEFQKTLAATEPSVLLSEDEVALLREGSTLLAIKNVRIRLGVTLHEAKLIVDRYCSS